MSNSVSKSGVQGAYEIQHEVECIGGGISLKDLGHVR
jgi:hypothetical protein